MFLVWKRMAWIPRKYLWLVLVSMTSLTIFSGISHFLASSRVIHFLKSWRTWLRTIGASRAKSSGDEHMLERAANDLVVSWKVWIRDHWPNKSGNALRTRIERPSPGLPKGSRPLCVTKIELPWCGPLHALRLMRPTLGSWVLSKGNKPMQQGYLVWTIPEYGE